MQKRWVSGLKRRDGEEMKVRLVRFTVEDMMVERSKSLDSLGENFTTSADIYKRDHLCDNCTYLSSNRLLQQVGSHLFYHRSISNFP